MHQNSTSTTDFSCFPVELHQHILCFMDPEDLLALRKTSKYFLALTHDPHLWVAVYFRMRQTYPLSCSESEFAALTYWQAERLLVRACKIDKLFQTFREHAHQCIVPSGQTNRGPLVALSFLSERFLLSVDDTVVVYVWETGKLALSAEDPTFPRARLTLVGWTFLTYSMSSDHSTLYVVLSNGTRAHIFSLALPMNTPDMDEPRFSFRDIAYFDMHFDKVHGIDADTFLVMLQVSDHVIQVMDWRTGNRSNITLLHEINNATNHVITLCMCGPYIMCLRNRSIDAYPLPLPFLNPDLATDQSLPALQHTHMSFLPKTTLSRVRCDRASSGDVYTFCALSEDVHQGRYYYQVNVQTTPVPALSVRMIGFDGTPGWLSAWDLGSTGLRGAWVHTPFSGLRCVVAFTASPSASPSGRGCRFGVAKEEVALDVSPEMAPPFDKQVVSIVSSWDSDDDVTACAVSEFTGRIALGSRAGAIALV